jgi:hypothetical protein
MKQTSSTQSDNLFIPVVEFVFMLSGDLHHHDQDGTADALCRRRLVGCRHDGPSALDDVTRHRFLTRTSVDYSIADAVALAV